MLGAVACGCYDDIAVVGAYYVAEEYRHSGIGEKLFREILRRLPNKTIIFHASKRNKVTSKSSKTAVKKSNFFMLSSYVRRNL